MYHFLITYFFFISKYEFTYTNIIFITIFHFPFHFISFKQRVLNNCFSYDLVPSPSVIERALRACRRVNDYATAVRVFEGLKHKVENKEQYQAYLEELKDVREELGIDLKEELFV